MKKIILFIFTLFLITTKVNAETFRMGEKLNPLFYVQRSDLNRSHNGLLFKLLRSDNEFVYCIEPFETRVSSVEYTEYNYNNSIFGLSNEQLDKLNMIGYFGYGYKNHTDIKWYGITQFLIWSNLNLTDIYLTDTLYGNKIESYNDEINEIYSLIDDYKKLPSFANRTIYYTKNNTFELTDLNEVLDNFDIISSDLDIKKDNNRLIIKTKEDGTYKISFVKRSPIERNYKLYYAPDTQNFIYPGKFSDITFDLTIKVVTGKVNLTKIGLSSSIDSTLGGAIYGVYQNDLQVGSITTDSDGMGYIDNLPIGKYMIKEIVPSKGYMLDINKFNIEITDSTRDIYIESYEKLIFNRLIINKYYGEEDNYIKEDGAVFNIYDSNYNLYKTVETNNGVIDISLPYGNYRVEQIEGIEGYTMSEPFNIKIDVGSFNRYDLYDELIKGDLVLNKYSMDLETCEKEDGAVFEIYKDNSLYGTYETIDGLIDIKLPYGKYLIKQIKGMEGYKFVDDFEVFIEKADKYEYDLYDELIYGNLIINKYYGDNIKEDGAIFQVSNETTSYEMVTVDGKTSIELPYGNYQVTQLKGIEGYSYVDDFNVSITDQDSNYDLYDEIIVNVPNTGIKRSISYLFILYIGIGLSLIIYSLKKTTH